MRPTITFLIALPAIAAAQQQKPLIENLQSWFDKAKSYIPAGTKEPVAAGAAKAAAQSVTPLTKSNWQSVLSAGASNPKDGPEEWMVLVTGGNKSCYGRCAGVDKAWNETAAVFAADPTAPHLASINCDQEPILCATWATGPASVWHIQRPVPQTDQSTPATTIHVIKLNTTTTTAGEIIAIHTGKTYEREPVYEGAFHPFDGLLAKYYLNVPLGQALFYFSLIPSWAFMIVISMVSRNLMLVYLAQ
ncbi:MAG: hypothetical protein Q9191_006826 [Dirinaria sp. TL-2023a]